MIKPLFVNLIKNGSTDFQLVPHGQDARATDYSPIWRGKFEGTETR
jgi:hypothetical protein